MNLKYLDSEIAQRLLENLPDSKILKVLIQRDDFVRLYKYLGSEADILEGKLRNSKYDISVKTLELNEARRETIAFFRDLQNAIEDKARDFEIEHGEMSDVPYELMGEISCFRANYIDVLGANSSFIAALVAGDNVAKAIELIQQTAREATDKQLILSFEMKEAADSLCEKLQPYVNKYLVFRDIDTVSLTSLNDNPSR